MQRIALFAAALLAVSSAQELTPSLATAVQRLRANGTLTFTCTSTTEFRESAASVTLYDLNNNNVTAGTFNGFTWTANDTSSTQIITNGIFNTTFNNASRAASNYAAVAQRNGGNEGNRTFDRIIFVTRYDTVNGFIDSTNCSNFVPIGNGLQITVPFQATYGFYRSAQPANANGSPKAVYRAVGTLRYNCTGSGFVPVQISAPLSLLNGTQIGTYNGTFAHNDGSSTRSLGTNIVDAVNNAPGLALPYFLQNALNNVGNLTLNNISAISRFDTVGGAIPAGSVCNSTYLGNITLTDIPFEASYGFYAAQIIPGASNNTNNNNTTPTTTGPNNSGAMLTFSAFVGIALLVLA